MSEMKDTSARIYALIVCIPFVLTIGGYIIVVILSEQEFELSSLLRLAFVAVVIVLLALVGLLGTKRSRTRDDRKPV